MSIPYGARAQGPAKKTTTTKKTTTPKNSSLYYSDGTKRNIYQNNTAVAPRPKSTPTSYGPTTGISGGALGNTPLPAPNPRTVTSLPTPVITQTSWDGGGGDDSGGGGGGGGGGGAGAPQINPDVDYLQEAGYVAQVGALEEALKAFKAQDTADRGRYDLDYAKGLGDLGYKDTNYFDDVDGSWDWNDVLTASGRGYQQNTNDFASRGMLESQGYFDSLKNLERSLEDQRGAMGTARQNWRAEKDTSAANYNNQDVAARNAAKVDAIARLSAQLGLS